MPDFTPGPWHWTAQDHSLAILSGPDYIMQQVLSISPCPACIGRAKPKEWKWGRCTTPNEANAALIAFAPTLLAQRDKLVDGINALLGLLQIAASRPDVSAELHNVLTNNHRIIEARSALRDAGEE